MERVIIFSRTKHGADRIAKNLAIDGHEAAAIHGNKSQNARQAALKGFANGTVRILVATDIAARGIDVQGITHVVNYELPDDPENYVHRIGRTGRNGASGVAITLCDGTEKGKLRDVERLIRRTLPVSGDVNLVEQVQAPRAPRNAPGAPAGARSARNPKQNARKFNTPRPGGERTKGGAPGNAAARDPKNPLAPAKSVKPPRGDGLRTKQRWTSAAKKAAARNRREA